MNNLIYRDKAIEVISKLPVKVDNLGYTWMIAGDVLKQIDDMPSVELKCKKGEWIKYEALNGIDCGIQCSKCGYQSSAYAPSYGSAFCPNCGADMRGE